MAETLERSRLHVEGTDDQHTLVHLLRRNGIAYDPDKFENSPAELPRFIKLESVEKLIDGIETSVKTSTNRIVGFLLDADEPLLSRWESVSQRLSKAGVDNLPKTPLATGFIGESSLYKARVGVWLMPDNVHDGKLEDFLRMLIDQNDALIGHAESSTDLAKGKGAEFTDRDKIKAIIHAWLAWQEEPGKPYGLAMRAKYFRHDSPTAAVFVAWFKSLYRLT
jgi:hypothetical protein